MSRTEPYRVAVWGAGGVLGGALSRQVLRTDALDLVAALVYSPEKTGVDVGKLLELDPVGVITVSGIDALIETRPEVVLYAGADVLGADFDDVTRLLEAGINVITPIPYRRYPGREDDLPDRLAAAGERGGATLAVGGVNPDFMWERLVATVSGICTEIDRIKVTEIFRADTVGGLMFDATGFGQPVDPDAGMDELILEFAGRYFAAELYLFAAHLGVAVTSLEGSCDRDLAPVDIHLPGREIPAGTLARLTLHWTARTDGGPTLEFDGIYYCGDELRPAVTEADECWIVEIEGRPSLRLTIDTMASLDGSPRYDGDPTPPGYYATGNSMLAHIARVVAAPPGYLAGRSAL